MTNTPPTMIKTYSKAVETFRAACDRHTFSAPAKQAETFEALTAAAFALCTAASIDHADDKSRARAIALGYLSGWDDRGREGGAK